MKTVDPLHGVAGFLAVAEHASFTAAAEAIGLTRSTISAQVADLEARLGLRLFHRSTRLVRLTSAGEAYREVLGDIAERVRAFVAFIAQKSKVEPDLTGASPVRDPRCHMEQSGRLQGFRLASPVDFCPAAKSPPCDPRIPQD